MSGPNTDVRVADLPPEHAILLGEVYRFAAEGARLRHAMQTTRLTAADSVQLLERLGEVDRDRELTEIQARGEGVPGSWVDQARQAGQSGREWRREQLLRAPTRTQAGRRTVKRVVADTRQLTDMAAITAARERLLTSSGVTNDPEPAAAQQLRRNMDALWTRATRTAAAIGMSEKERARAFTVTDEQLRQQIAHYLDYPLDELNALWHRHTTPDIAASVRRSLSSLRRSPSPNAAPIPDLDQELPKPAQLRERARTALGEAVADQPSSATAIEEAIAAAMPDRDDLELNTAASVDEAEPVTSEAFPDAGPDP
ncbi:hypothetical protein [Nocardia lijiangensis]|uniref:hypothetical protein n=1 Tax=Nocardia lijiangensis TaxID=299618 RepID=UPI00082C6DB1|nr:hypothetical protein [Nocardia lijiangensis]